MTRIPAYSELSGFSFQSEPDLLNYLLLLLVAMVTLVFSHNEKYGEILKGFLFRIKKRVGRNLRRTLMACGFDI